MALSGSKLTPEDSDLKWFVDREGVKRDFRERLRWNQGDSSKVTVYYGPGGIGKTSVRKVIENEILKPANVPYVVVYYEPAGSPLSPEGTFAHIRQQFERWGLEFPRFDMVWSIYLQVTLLRRIPKNDLPSGIGAIADLVSGLGVVGNISQAAIGATELYQSARQWFSERYRGGVAQLRDMSAQELLRQMPQALASDLEDMVWQPKFRGENGDCRITVIIDGFERLAVNHQDDWFVREFCRPTHSILVAIFGREALHWEQADSTWRESNDNYPITNLPASDADEYLKLRKLDNSDLRGYLVGRAAGWPRRLALYADRSKAIEKKTNQQARIEDFANDETVVDLDAQALRSLLEEIPEGERFAAYLAAIPRWFNRDIFELLPAETANAPYLFKTVTDKSFTEKVFISDESYIIHEDFRELLRNEARNVRRKKWLEWNKELSDYHSQFRSDLLHLTEELYHKFIVDPEAALRLFRDNFYTRLELSRLGECDQLLNAEPPEQELTTAIRQWLKLALADRLQREWIRRENVVRAEKELDFLLSQDLPLNVRARALRLKGLVYTRLGDRVKAVDLFNQASKIFETMTEPIMQAAALRDAGLEYFLMGDFQNTLRVNNQALRLVRYLRPSSAKSQHYEYQTAIAEAGFIGRPASNILKWIAGAYARTGRVQLAIKPLRNMMAEGQENSDVREQIEALSELGLVYRRLGRLTDAQSAYEQVILLQEEIGSLTGKANSLCGLGMSIEQGTNFETAKPKYEDALELFEQLHDKGGQAKSLFGLARVAGHLRNTDLALQYYDQAILLYREINFAAHIGPALLCLAKLKTTLSEFAEASTLCEEALGFFSGLKDNVGEAATHTNLGLIYYLQNELELALDHWNEAFGLYLGIVRPRKAKSPVKQTRVDIVPSINPQNFWVNWLSMYAPDQQRQTLASLDMVIAHIRQNLSTMGKEQS